ncbi:MAG: hypothetical protein FVQ82_03975 [Planctomycetes bacterium]|nr:hypothetical protein [Planctomycetota bacterium]
MAKDDFREQLGKKKSAVIRKMYLLLGFVTIVIVTSMIFILFMGRHMTAVYTPLIDAAMEIKLEATTGHLWFEEVISGDHPELLKGSFEHIDNSDWYAKAMLEGGESAEGKFIPLKDAQLRDHIKLVREKIAEFREITEKRWEMKDQAGIGSEIDQQYDAIFKDFIKLADDVETELQALIAEKLKIFQTTQVLLIGLCLAVFVIVGVILRKLLLAQLRDEIKLRAANQQLDASNQQLDASNQQLLANEQQLRAANQQLDASNQQLLANEQQLRAANQQLDASNQQLKANEQQLRASNQQLDASNQQLLAKEQALKTSKIKYQDLSRTLAAKNDELQSIVYISSHDLRSPLVNINGFSCALTEGCEQIANFIEKLEIDEDLKKQIMPVLTEDIPEALGFIGSSTDRMSKLIDGLLRVSRIGTCDVDFKKIDMDKIISQIGDTVKFRTDSVGAEVVYGDLPDCTGDEDQVTQVFANLIDNAIKYLDPKRKGVIKINGERAGDKSVYYVEDNGIGIAANHENKVFGIYQRLDPTGPVEGEGLGLTIVRRIIDRHNGDIQLESQVDCGTKFTVTLPE